MSCSHDNHFNHRHADCKSCTCGYVAKRRGTTARVNPPCGNCGSTRGAHTCCTLCGQWGHDNAGHQCSNCNGFGHSAGVCPSAPALAPARVAAPVRVAAPARVATSAGSFTVSRPLGGGLVAHTNYVNVPVCGHCKQVGHGRSNCPLLAPAPAAQVQLLASPGGQVFGARVIHGVAYQGGAAHQPQFPVCAKCGCGRTSGTHCPHCGSSRTK